MAELWKAPKRRSMNLIHFVQLFFPTTCIHHHRTKDLNTTILAVRMQHLNLRSLLRNFVNEIFTTFFKLPYSILATAMNSRYHAKAGHLTTENRCLPRLSMILEYLQAEILSAIAWAAG